MPYITNALRHMNNYLEHYTTIYDPERALETDFVYLSTEIMPSSQVIAAGKIVRPRVEIELGNIVPLGTSTCSSHKVTAKVN